MYGSRMAVETWHDSASLKVKVHSSLRLTSLQIPPTTQRVYLHLDTLDNCCWNSYKTSAITMLSQLHLEGLDYSIHKHVEHIVVVAEKLVVGSAAFSARALERMAQVFKSTEALHRMAQPIVMQCSTLLRSPCDVTWGICAVQAGVDISQRCILDNEARCKMGKYNPY